MAGRAGRSKRKREIERQDSSAGETPPGCPPKIDRIRHIARLMASGRYRFLETRLELAAAWGLTEGAIRSHAAEASRLLVIPPEELEQLRATAAGTFTRIARKAERMRNQVTGLPDWRSAIEANELSFRYRGLVDVERPAGPETRGPAQIVVTLAPLPPEEAAKAGPPKADEPPATDAATAEPQAPQS